MSERQQRPMRWRWSAALVVLAAALIAGAARRVVYLHDAEPRFAVVSSRSAVVGTWKMEDGNAGQIEFAANGRFSAVGLPVETFTLSLAGVFTGAGSWSLVDRGGSVALVPDHPPSGTNSDASLAVVRADDRLQLCVTSGSPGVLCDYLLRLAASRR
ncbi:hypothetical protein ACWEO4_24605 [Streptomyces sp. NPDC004393]|uniref:hypothetical protein n=1 Tax=Streptomyces sp. NPDC004533 TaxID=3154278 RepID=UPI0033B3CCB5